MNDETTCNFKVGDRVRLNQRYGGWSAGTLGTVTDTRGGLVMVAADTPHSSGSTRRITAFGHRFDLVKSRFSPPEPATSPLLEASALLDKWVIVTRQGHPQPVGAGRVSATTQDRSGKITLSILDTNNTSKTRDFIYGDRYTFTEWIKE